MIDKEQVIKLIANGVPTSSIAAAMGCDDSYISQLRADPEVQAAVAELKSATLSQDLKFDELLDDAESLALQKVQQTLRFANLGQAVKAFQVLNNAKRRNDSGASAGANVTHVTVAINLPAAIAPHYVTDAKAQIVEVEGKTMQTATPRSLDQLLAARAGNKENLPAITAVEKAVSRLGAITIPAVKPVRRLTDSKITPDML